MRTGWPLRMKLNDVIWDAEYEQKVMENLRYCKNLNGNNFKVILWYEDINESVIKDFVKRNQDILLEINIEITKSHKTDAWFIINSNGEKNSWRYKYDGDILNGIVEYIKVIKHIKERDSV